MRDEALNGHFEAILAFYRGLWPTMKVTPTSEWACPPYAIDWTRYFSPIESALWGDIRQEGLILYPQHPVAGYFVDFGHPVAKVAIECDGKQWHQDHAKDRTRQAAIEAKGWRVYRLSGKQCMENSDEVEDPETGLWHYELSYAQQLLRAIGLKHGISFRSRRQAKEAA